MRLIAWNANFNGKRRTLEQDAEILAPLHADILVISESAAPSILNPLGATWVGRNAVGLAVVGRAGLSVKQHPANDRAPSLMIGLEVSAACPFFLLAMWPVKGPLGPSYHQTLMSGLELFSDRFAGMPIVMAGDFNSSTKVASQSKTHPKFVKAANDLGLVSAYHYHSGELPGSESGPTYRHGNGIDKLFHIDYCFVSNEIALCATVSVLRSAYWSALSDHYPLVLDIPDAGLCTQAKSA